MTAARTISNSYRNVSRDQSNVLGPCPRWRRLNIAQSLEFCLNHDHNP